MTVLIKFWQNKNRCSAIGNPFTAPLWSTPRNIAAFSALSYKQIGYACTHTKHVTLRAITQ